MSKARETLLNNVLKLHEGTPDPRLREIMLAVVRHLHQLAAEINLTHGEWLAALKFLNQVGQKGSADRDEFMLLSDVLGISSLMDALHESPGATEGTVLGPYYVPNSPPHKNGESVIETDDGGVRLVVSGTVRGSDGKPLANALVDVWSCAANGLYPAQDPVQTPTNLRGVFSTDQDGRYEFLTLRPTNYSVPTDGPVGELLQKTNRTTQRAAHIHLIVSAPGHKAVTTHLFDSECRYLKSDAVFSVHDSLVRRFEKVNDQLWKANFDVVLTAA